MWHKALAAMAMIALVAAGCANDGGSGEGDNALTFWTVYDTSDRIATMKPVLQKFTEETGIKVDLVGVSASDLSQAMVSSAAAGDLPDVVVHGVDLAGGWLEEGILDPAAATAVIKDLGPKTFNSQALDLVRVDSQKGEYATVPSDGWGQMIFYRTDLFEQHGLKPPTTYKRVLKAARTLHGDGMNGFALGNKGGDGFTQQVFEHLLWPTTVIW